MIIFGKKARPKNDSKEIPVHSGFCGDVAVTVLRWNTADFEIDGLKLPDGHFLSFRIKDNDRQMDLFQGRSVFYIEERIPRLSGSGVEVEQGDGVTSPKWHKCDRAWPSHNGLRFEFVGQLYFENQVVYIFRGQVDGRKTFAVYKDDVDRQDAEEHYKTEAEPTSAGDVASAMQSQESVRQEDSH